MTGPTGDDGYTGMTGAVPLFGGGPPHSHSSSSDEIHAGVFGVVLFFPAGDGGTANLAPEIGKAVPLEAHAASPASVEDW